MNGAAPISVLRGSAEHAAVCAPYPSDDLRRLDGILAEGLIAARERYGPEASVDMFRGLYVDAEQAAAALGRAGIPLLPGRDGADGIDSAGLLSWPDIAASHPGWRWVRDTYDLTDQELDVLLVALAPEVDLGYERLYGYLQDDVTRCRPTVNLVLDLSTRTIGAKLSSRALFGSDRPLIAERLIRLVAAPNSLEPPLLAHIVVLDEQIVDVLLRQGGLARGLVPYCRLVTSPSANWSEAALPAARRRPLLTAARAAYKGRRPMRLYFRGRYWDELQFAAEALAGALGAPLLLLDLSDLPATAVEADEVLFRTFREATLHGALLYLALAAEPADQTAALARHLRAHRGVAILAGSQAWVPPGGPPLGVTEVSFDHPGLELRREAWSRCLAEAGVEASADLVDALAGRFRFGRGRIANAVDTAVASAGLARPPRAEPTVAELSAAARAQTRHRLAALTRQIEPAFGWEDLVLPAESVAQLREICQRLMGPAGSGCARLGAGSGRWVSTLRDWAVSSSVRPCAHWS